MTQNNNTRDDKNRKKKLAILFCFSLAVILIGGSLLAYFSDTFTGTQNVTAGTLVLEGSAKFYINGSSDEATVADLECLNPGDVVKVVIAVKNTGSKSAWLQSSFDLSAPGLSGTQFAGAFTVYEGNSTSGDPLTITPGTGSISFTDAGKAILDGSYEKETALGALNSVAASMTYTIVFSSAADNDFQGATIAIGYSVKALQYRNNPNPDWNAAVELIKQP